jgi:hypothetical protein
MTQDIFRLDIFRLLEDFFPPFFTLLFFLQTQWLSFLAGMAWGRASGKSVRRTLRWEFLITSLLVLQTAGCCLLISQMYCGQTGNTILQGAGGLCLFCLGGFTGRYLVASLTPRRLMGIALGGGAILFGWQLTLTRDYFSMERLMFFTLGLFLASAVTAISKFLLLCYEAAHQRTPSARQWCLTAVLIGLAHLIFTTAATFSAAIAFDCGI